MAWRVKILQNLPGEEGIINQQEEQRRSRARTISTSVLAHTLHTSVLKGKVPLLTPCEENTGP